MIHTHMELIAKRHKEWLRIALFFGMSMQDAEDIVQELYCALLKIEEQDGTLDRLFNNGKVNDVYMFQSIKNKCINASKVNGRHVGLEGCPELPCESSEGVREDKEQVEAMLSQVEQASAGLSWFDRELLKIYYRDGKSLRKLAKETHISFPTIAYSIKKAKTHIKKKLTKI